MCLQIVKEKIKIITTINIYLSMLTVGSFAITVPYVFHLKSLVNTDFYHIGFIYTSKSVGYLVGALLGGVVLDLVRSQMKVLNVCLFFVTVTMFGIPWSKTVGTLYSFAAVYGLSVGAIETGSNVIIIKMWGSGPVLQGLHFTLALGSLISPLIAGPFLKNQRILSNSSNATNYSSDNNTVHPGIADITYPFSIIGIFALLVTIMLFVTNLASPIEDRGYQKEVKEKSNRTKLFIYSLIVFSFLMFFVLSGTEIAFLYAVIADLRVAPNVADSMSSAFQIAYTITRFLSVFFSIKFSNKTLIITNICLITVAGVMLLFLTPTEGVLWAVVIIYGAGTASVYASLCGWLSNYIKITNKISAIFPVACAIGELAVPSIMKTIPEMLAYVMFPAIIVSTISFQVLQTIIKRSNKKRDSVDLLPNIEY